MALFEDVQSAVDEAFCGAMGRLDSLGNFAGRGANGEEEEKPDDATIARLRAIQASCTKATDSLAAILHNEVRQA